MAAYDHMNDRFITHGETAFPLSPHKMAAACRAVAHHTNSLQLFSNFGEQTFDGYIASCLELPEVMAFIHEYSDKEDAIITRERERTVRSWIRAHINAYIWKM